MAVANAGGPAAYDIATATGDYGSIGYTQESTQKGYAGQNVISSFSKSVNSPHSSVHVTNSRISNDALIASYGYEQPSQGYAQAAPLVAHGSYGYAQSAPIVTKTAYATPAYAQAAPVVAHGSYGYAQAAPLVAHGSYGYAQSAPIVAKTAYATPAYAQAAPVVAHGSYGYAQAAPLVAHGSYGYAQSAPVVAHGYAGAPVVHASFTGLGTSYAW